MNAETEQLKKLNDSNKGWVENRSSNGKVHYYILDEDDFFVALCGVVSPTKDLAGYMNNEYHFDNSIDHCCKRCLSKYRKALNVGHVEIKLKSIIV